MDKLLMSNFLKKREQEKEEKKEVKEIGSKVNYYKEEFGKIVLSSEEKIFEPSYGTEPILIRIEKLLEDNDRADTILINIGTIIRNTLEKDLTEEESVRRVEYEVGLIVDRIKQLYEIYSKVKFPYLVFYVTDYRKDYPKERIRPITPAKVKYEELCDIFYKKLNERVYKEGNLTVHFVKLDKGNDYGYQLQVILRNINKIIPYVNYTGNYLLISHFPLDYHVMNRCPQGRLINSHTGELLDRKQLGYKVFKEFEVPYNQLLHGILGDTVQVLPTVKVSTRMKIKDLSKSNNWMIKTESQILKDLRSINVHVDERIE